MNRFRFNAWLLGLSRPMKQTAMLAADLVLLTAAAWGAYSLRFGQAFIPNFAQTLLILTAPVLAIPIFVVSGLYRSVIRYLGEQALWTIIKSMSLAALIWAALAFMTQMTGITGVPRSIPLFYWMLGLLVTGGSRFIARWVLWMPLRQRFKGRQVLIYGANDAGRQLAASLRMGRELFPAGFLDDNEALHGKDMDGLRIYPPSRLGLLIERFDIKDVIVTLPGNRAAAPRQIVQFLQRFPVKVRILPAMTDIASGRHLVSMVREVDIGDLLGRDPVAPDESLLRRCILGKVVMVTGAGGSIGSELCRQILAGKPAKLVVLEASEFALYQIDRALRPAASCELVASLGSARDARLVERLIAEHRVQTLYHAAAHKHVPLVQANVLEGASNNVLGTLVTARAAFEQGVETFVLISTDKAVRPTNIMGATKRWAELVVTDFAHRAREQGRNQRFCAVRFGNVLGSSGSVIPLFKEQISRGGPVTVTDPEVTRYFMSIHEAVQLVIQAGSLAENGEIFLLDMGEPVKIFSLAQNMIRLAGHTVRDALHPQGGIEIQFTGLRPGEKLYEELLIADENAHATPHPKIMRAIEPCLDTARMTTQLTELVRCIEAGDVEGASALLMAQADGLPAPNSTTLQ